MYVGVSGCLTGAALAALVIPLNLGELGNSVAWWLGIQPYDLFFYVFLPPLLLDAAVRIDFYLFKKVHPCPHRFLPVQEGAPLSASISTCPRRCAPVRIDFYLSKKVCPCLSSCWPG
jgi:hypothetical protein